MSPGRVMPGVQPGRVQLAGIGEQVWPGLERDVDVEGGCFSGGHYLLGHQDSPAAPQEILDRRGLSGRVAGDENSAASGKYLQDFVSNEDLGRGFWGGAKKGEK